MTTPKHTSWKEEFRRKYEGANKYDSESISSMQMNAMMEDIDTLIKQVQREAYEKIENIIKQHSANLPITIERHGTYAQGMHSGIDLCINEILLLKSSLEEGDEQK